MHQSTLNTFIDSKDKERKIKTSANIKRKVNVRLGKRELEILNLIVEGKNNKEIAETMFISEGTVKNTISHMLNKLNLKDRTQLAVFAVKNNIL